MTDQDNAQKLKAIKSDLRACLTSAKFGLTTNELLKDYKEVTGESTFPNLEFGFVNPNDFLKSEFFSDIMKFENEKWHVIVNENSKHIRDFVEGQRSDRNKDGKWKNQKNQKQNQSKPKRKSSDFDIDECDEIFKDLKIRHGKEKIVGKTDSSSVIQSTVTSSTTASSSTAITIKIPKQIDILQQLPKFEKIEQKIYQILKSEKGFISQHTLNTRLDLLEKMHGFRPKMIDCEEIVEEMSLVEANNARILNIFSEDTFTFDAYEAFQALCDDRQIVKRWKQIDRNSVFHCNDAEVSTEDAIVIKIFNSEASKHWASPQLLHERFLTSSNNYDYFKENNQFGNVNQFFKHYGRNIMKKVRFYVNEEQEMVRVTDDQASKLKIPKYNKFVRWVLLEDLD